MSACSTRRSRSRHGGRRGFTLVELLVVIAILGLLVGLLLPAVQAARESSRLSACLNNVRQLAQAMLQHESGSRRLPTGIWDQPFVSYSKAMGNGQVYTSGRSAWVQILPLIEQQSLASLYRTDLRFIDPLQGPAISVHIPLYKCPSDDTAGRVFQHTSMPLTISRSNYVVNFGSNTLATTAIGYGWGGNVSRSGLDFTTNGPFQIGTPKSLSFLTDGTSATALVSEVISGKIDKFTAAGDTWDSRGLWAWWGAGGPTYMHKNTPNSSVGDVMLVNPGSDIQCPPGMGMPTPCGAGSGDTDKWHVAARSQHPGGVVMACADGRTTFVANEVDLPVWNAFGTAKSGDQGRLP